MRDKLIELIEEAAQMWDENPLGSFDEVCADHLIANGVIVPPVKVGDETFLLLERTSGGFDILDSKCVRETANGAGRVFSMYIDCPEIGNTLEYRLDDIGKTVFLSREDAEKALRGGGQE